MCGADVIVRITGDCPLIDPLLVDLCVSEFVTSKVDYLNNNGSRSYPDGLDIEVFTMAALAKTSSKQLRRTIGST